MAALDVGKAELVCCVRVPDESRPGRRLQEVTPHSTMTRSLLVLADRLRSLGVTRVVMEGTSSYWKPPFYLLEAAGFEVWLVNAMDVKHLPGRPKTDLLTELLRESPQLRGRIQVGVDTVPVRDRCRRVAAGTGRIGGASGRVA